MKSIEWLKYDVLFEDSRCCYRCVTPLGAIVGANLLVQLLTIAFTKYDILKKSTFKFRYTGKMLSSVRNSMPSSIVQIAYEWKPNKI